MGSWLHMAGWVEPVVAVMLGLLPGWACQVASSEVRSGLGCIWHGAVLQRLLFLSPSWSLRQLDQELVKVGYLSAACVLWRPRPKA